jgi:predicted regulator of Ras-like GTPase activity (Roadblock/LC7/MglB family)
MDAAQALAELQAASSRIDAAVIAGEKGEIVASTLDDAAASERVAAAAVELVAAGAGGKAPVTHAVAIAPTGVLFAAVGGGNTIAAVTGPDPTVGLVLYDLKAALRGIDPPKPKRARTTRAKAPAKPKKDADA